MHLQEGPPGAKECEFFGCGAHVRREVSKGGGDRADAWDPQEGERGKRAAGLARTGRILAAASRATCFLGAARDAWMAGCRAGRVGNPGSEGTWGEAQVCPTCIPLGLGISQRRALLRGAPGPGLIPLQGLQGEDVKETAVGATG